MVKADTIARYAFHWMTNVFMKSDFKEQLNIEVIKDSKVHINYTLEPENSHGHFACIDPIHPVTINSNYQNKLPSPFT